MIMMDGSEGTLALEENGKQLRFDDPYDVYANKDPRLFASVYLPDLLAKVPELNGKEVLSFLIMKNIRQQVSRMEEIRLKSMV